MAPQPDTETVEGDDAEGSSGTTDASDAAALADELGRVQLRSIDGRRLRARIERIVDHDDDMIRVWYRLPYGVDVFEDFEKPIPWSDRFKFARVVEDLGYSPSSLGVIEGEEIVLERIGEQWRAEDPDHRWNDDFPPGVITTPYPIASLGVGITALYLLLLFVATVGAVNVTGAFVIAFALCTLTWFIASHW